MRLVFRQPITLRGTPYLIVEPERQRVVITQDAKLRIFHLADMDGRFDLYVPFESLRYWRETSDHSKQTALKIVR